MRVMFVILPVLIWATASSGFSPLTRTLHPHCGASRRMTFLSQSSQDDSIDNGNKTSSEEDSMEEPFEAFAAFLSDENTTPPSQDDRASVSSSNVDTTASWSRLLALASRTGRGEYASKADKQEAMSYIQLLELENPTPHPTNSSTVIGKWELVYSDTQLFRSSPFFMAGRAVCQDGDEAQRFNWFCDMHRKALAISNIGAVRQIVSNNTLTSEFEVTVGAVPFLGVKPPFKYSGGLPVSTENVLLFSVRRLAHVTHKRTVRL